MSIVTGSMSGNFACRHISGGADTQKVGYHQGRSCHQGHSPPLPATGRQQPQSRTGNTRSATDAVQCCVLRYSPPVESQYRVSSNKILGVSLWVLAWLRHYK